MFEKLEENGGIFSRVYQVVRKVPYGKVATYSQVGMLAGGYSGRIAGFALAGLRSRQDHDVPWQRVINIQGRISKFGLGSVIQRQLLEEEGVVFDEHGRVDFDVFGWEPSEEI